MGKQALFTYENLVLEYVGTQTSHNGVFQIMYGAIVLSEGNANEGMDTSAKAATVDIHTVTVFPL